MAGDIGPGDFVEAVNTVSVSPGTVAQVIGLAPPYGHCRKCGPSDGLFLSIGAGNRGPEWCANHWRPVYRPKSSILRDLLQPIPAETEDA